LPRTGGQNVLPEAATLPSFPLEVACAVLGGTWRRRAAALSANGEIVNACAAGSFSGDAAITLVSVIHQISPEVKPRFPLSYSVFLAGLHRGTPPGELTRGIP
jgi:hypothetical protein